MKADPINLILSKNLIIDKSFYFISGNEITLMNKIKNILIEATKSNGAPNVEKIKKITLKTDNVGLFNKEKVFIVSDIADANATTLDKLSNNKDVFIFFQENSPKNKAFKTLLTKRNDSCLFDCYELTKETKSRLLSNELSQATIKIDKDLYWQIIEILDDKYMFFENELEKIKALKNTPLTYELITKIISRNNTNIEKLFFNLFQDNAKIINDYNLKISTLSDVNYLYYIIRQYSFLIIGNDNEKEFEKNIPKYLFREKGFLIKLFRSYGKNKKKLLLSLIYKTEKAIKKNNRISFLLGLRFLLSFKKISTS
tara:strand:+ start:411 stop:1349 length:939 start_codon:yes stop_codon:yes gene_type:complete